MGITPSTRSPPDGPVQGLARVALPERAGQVHAGQSLPLALVRWDGFCAYVDDGWIEIDNNLTEQQVKPFVIARKNFLFAQSVAGAHALCAHFSLIRTAKQHGLAPYRYYDAVLKAVPHCQRVEDYEALLPWNMTLAAGGVPARAGGLNGHGRIAKRRVDWEQRAQRVRELCADPALALWQKARGAGGVYNDVQLDGLQSKHSHRIFATLSNINEILAKYPIETVDDYQLIKPEDRRVIIDGFKSFASIKI
jgi:hypothetical protein